MKQKIENYDEVIYYNNGNIQWIHNYNHGKLNGYRAWFYLDKSIEFKQYWNMNKKIYEESHYDEQIRIKI